MSILFSKITKNSHDIKYKGFKEKVPLIFIPRSFMFHISTFPLVRINRLYFPCPFLIRYLFRPQSNTLGTRGKTPSTRNKFIKLDRTIRFKNTLHTKLIQNLPYWNICIDFFSIIFISVNRYKERIQLPVIIRHLLRKKVIRFVK